MCQHVCYRCARRTNKEKTQVGCRPKYEASPSLANVREVVPPAFVVPGCVPNVSLFVPGSFLSCSRFWFERASREYIEK
jgi:hypothetical protein